MVPPRTSKTWFLLVDHKFQALGTIFSINISCHDLVEDFKNNLKKVVDDDPDLPDDVARRLQVWKTKGTKIINKNSFKQLATILRSIDTNDEDTIERVSEFDGLADLELSDNQVLLVQLSRRTSHVSTLAAFSYWA
jgi:hypothetical protein